MHRTPEPLSTIAIDWLQLNCKSLGKIKEGKHGFYEVKKADYSTRHFKTVFFIYLAGEEVATLACEPHSEILDKGMNLLKINNKFLYQENLNLFVQNFLNVFKLEVNNITRLDVCIDFNTFLNGRMPESFISQFLRGAYIKTSHTKFKIFGDSKRGNIHLDYLKFGSETSEISYYLYNKSKELAEKVNKPYIKENWVKNGIDITKDVWRLEFSIKSNLKELVDTTTSEALGLISQLQIIRPENLKALFAACLTRYWSFATRSEVNRDSNLSRCKKVKFFDVNTSGLKLIRLSDKKNSNRADKIFLKKLKEFNDEIRGTNFDLSIASEELFYRFQRTRSLETWAASKGISID